MIVPFHHINPFFRTFCQISIKLKQLWRVFYPLQKETPKYWPCLVLQDWWLSYFTLHLSLVWNTCCKDTNNSSVNFSAFCDVTVPALDCIIWLKLMYLKFVVGQANKPDKFYWSWNSTVIYPTTRFELPIYTKFIRYEINILRFTTAWIIFYWVIKLIICKSERWCTAVFLNHYFVLTVKLAPRFFP